MMLIFANIYAVTVEEVVQHNISLKTERYIAQLKFKSSLLQYLYLILCYTAY